VQDRDERDGLVMPVFIYRAKQGPEKTLEGKVSAGSKEQAVEKLEKMGLVPIIVEEVQVDDGAKRHKKVSQGGERIGFTGGLSSFSRIRRKDVDVFTRQLASLIRASVPALRALSLIAEETENQRMRAVVDDLRSQVRDGKMLSDAMERYPSLFNSLYLNMVRSGERGGALAEVLLRLVDYREREDEIRGKVQAALAYPMLMIVVGIGTLFVMFTFFMPKLVGLFDDMGESLPWSTRMLIGISSWFSSYWYWLVFVFVFIFALFFRNKKGSKKKVLVDLFKLRMPFVRKFVMDAEVIKFARTLGLLLRNGLSVHESLKLATDTLDNEVLCQRLSDATNQIISKGMSLSDSLKGTGVFSGFFINMVAIGEESGRLEVALEEVVGVYEREVEQAIKVMTSLLEPLLILVIGGIVGFIVFGMLQPILSMGVIAR